MLKPLEVERLRHKMNDAYTKMRLADAKWRSAMRRYNEARAEWPPKPKVGQTIETPEGPVTVDAPPKAVEMCTECGESIGATSVDPLRRIDAIEEADPRFHILKSFTVYAGDEYDPDVRHERKPTGIVGASLALADLREAMATVRHEVPWARPGHGPTAADDCGQIFEVIDHSLRHLSAYLGVPPPRPGMI